MSDFTSTIYGQSFEKSWRQYWRLCKEAALPLLYLLLVSLFMTTDFVESQSFILSALGGSRHSLFGPTVYHLSVHSVIKLCLATQGHLRQWHKMQLILTTKTQPIDCLERAVVHKIDSTCSGASWTGIWSDSWSERWSGIWTGTLSGSETLRQISRIWT